MRPVSREEFYAMIYSYRGKPITKTTCMSPVRMDVFICWEDEIGRAYPETEEYFLNV